MWSNMQEYSIDNSTYILDVQHPYPGPQPFAEEDSEYFFGRETQIDELFDKIQKNSLTVLFGKSGIGKTSLLQAGLIPKLRKNYYLPIYLQTRFDWENEINPLERIKLYIEEKIKEVDEKAISIRDLTLWEYFHAVQVFGGMIKPVLIVDQFEEIFKFGKAFPEKVTPLILEIGDLVQNWVPVVVQEKSTNESLPYPVNEVDFRVIISFREDYLPQLINLNQWMPSLVNGRYHYRISQMKGEEAIQAVLKPGKEIIKKGAAIEIIRKIPATKDFDYNPYEIQKETWESKRIEPFLLALVCYQANERRIEENADEISLKLLSHITVRDIVADYYEEIISELEPNVRIAVEEQLLTPEGERKLQDIDSLKGFQEDDIEILVNKLILRKERRNNIDYIELIHDEFARVIKESRDIRREEEKRIAEKKKQEGEWALEKRRQEIELEAKKKKLRAMRIFSITSILVILIFIYLFLLANKQSKSAQVNSLTAEALLEFPNDSTRAIRIVEEAYKITQPNVPARTSKTLSDIGYSSFEKPFYIAILHHNGPIYSAVFSPDGRQILTASEDGTAKVWDLEGKLLFEVKHDARIMSAVFSPDGSRILTASWDKSVKLWDMNGMLLLDLPHNGIVSDVAFSLDGQRILTASRDGKVRIWNLKGKVLAILPYNKVVSSAVFSKDGHRLLTASWDKTVKVWDIKNEGKPLPLLDLKHNNTISSAVFSPDGQYILSALEQGAVYLWNLEGKLLLEFEVNEEVSSAMFSPDGQRILTTSRTGTVKLWNLAGKLLSEFKYNAPLYSAAFSPDGGLIVTASEDGTAKVWDLKNNIVTNLAEQTADMKIAIYSPNGSRIFTSSRDGTSRLWTSDGVFLHRLDNDRMLSSAVFSPDGSRILTTSQESSAKLWNLQGQLLGNVINSSDSDTLLSFAVFSPDGKQILTTSQGVTVQLWSLDGKLLGDVIHLNALISSAIFSPNGQLILTVSMDNIAKLWNLKGELLDEFKHNKEVSTAVFSPDGKKILTASADGTVIMWSPDGEKFFELNQKEEISSAVFSADGRKILTASKDRTSKLWDLHGNLLADLNKHKDTVNSAVFSPDGRQMLTASRDGTVKIWLTPEAIFDWLKISRILQLSRYEKVSLGIRDF
jgi:WD40 repeat protein/energy-coupling factor transporter ATP-binding protein EcfA2